MESHLFNDVEPSELKNCQWIRLDRNNLEKFNEWLLVEKIDQPTIWSTMRLVWKILTSSKDANDLLEKKLMGWLRNLNICVNVKLKTGNIVLKRTERKWWNSAWLKCEKSDSSFSCYWVVCVILLWCGNVSLSLIQQSLE